MVEVTVVSATIQWLRLETSILDLCKLSDTNGGINDD
jgi:hypothetical protein